MTDEIENTEAPTEETQQAAPDSISRDEFNSSMAKLRHKMVKEKEEAIAQALSGIDLEEYKTLKAKEVAAEEERAKERGDFEMLLKKRAAEFEERENSLKKEIYDIKVNQALLSAANEGNAINAKQVVELLKGRVRLNDKGVAEVLDESGAISYTESGDLTSVKDLVSDFMTANPHFARASTGGAGSQGAAGGSTQKQLSVENMLASWENGGKQAFAEMYGKK